MTPIGKILRAIRNKRDLSQRELGQMVDRTQTEIQRWETGEVRIPAEDLPKLAKALDISIAQFFDAEERPTHVA